jgi:hypothetical protein
MKSIQGASSGRQSLHTSTSHGAADDDFYTRQQMFDQPGKLGAGLYCQAMADRPITSGRIFSSVLVTYCLTGAASNQVDDVAVPFIDVGDARNAVVRHVKALSCMITAATSGMDIRTIFMILPGIILDSSIARTRSHLDKEPFSHQRPHRRPTVQGGWCSAAGVKRNKPRRNIRSVFRTKKDRARQRRAFEGLFIAEARPAPGAFGEHDQVAAAHERIHAFEPPDHHLGKPPRGRTGYGRTIAACCRRAGMSNGGFTMVFAGHTAYNRIESR